MTVNGRTGRIAAVLLFACFVSVIAARGVGNAVEFHTIRGIVEYASENALTIENKLHDITGLPILDENEEIVLERGNSLRGKMAVILYRDGKASAVKIFPPMPE